MNEKAFDQVSRLSRDDLEDFAVRAAIEIKRARDDARAADRFSQIVTGFVLGAIVAASAVLFGVLVG